MGQRHQIYAKSNYGYDTQVNMSCFHHQWLYGGTAIIQLKNILEFNKNASKYNNFSTGTMNSPDSTDQLVNNLYCINVQEGYFSTMIDLKRDVTTSDEIHYLHPERQDNNDGQTFIDFTTGDKPNVCFSFPYERDVYASREDDEPSSTVTENTVVTPLKYFSLYYDIENIQDNQDKEEVEFINEILALITWIEENTTLMTQEDLDNMYADTQNEELVLN